MVSEETHLRSQPNRIIYIRMLLICGFCASCQKLFAGSGIRHNKQRKSDIISI